MPHDPEQQDRIRLIHMLEAAEQARSFCVGRSRSTLDTDPMFRRAAMSCIQEIGEAASRVSPEGRVKVPHLPWNQVVGMRHRLVHVYFNINNDLLWEVLDHDLEPLIVALKEALDDVTQ